MISDGMNTWGKGCIIQGVLWKSLENDDNFNNWHIICIIINSRRWQLFLRRICGISSRHFIKRLMTYWGATWWQFRGAHTANIFFASPSNRDIWLSEIFACYLCKPTTVERTLVYRCEISFQELIKNEETVLYSIDDSSHFSPKRNSSECGSIWWSSGPVGSPGIATDRLETVDDLTQIRLWIWKTGKAILHILIFQKKNKTKVYDLSREISFSYPRRTKLRKNGELLKVM